MKYDSIESLYKMKDLNIFEIRVYFEERYNMVDIDWDCQEWGIMKRIFCRKKRGYVIKDNIIEGRIIITFYDKDKKTVEGAEKALRENKKFRLYSLLNSFNVDGLVRINTDGDNVILDCFRDNPDLGRDSIIYKLKKVCKDVLEEWETIEGVKMIRIVVPEEDFETLLEFLK